MPFTHSVVGRVIFCGGACNVSMENTVVSLFLKIVQFTTVQFRDWTPDTPASRNSEPSTLPNIQPKPSMQIKPTTEGPEKPKCEKSM
jgi:hypothetical protein